MPTDHDPTQLPDPDVIYADARVAVINKPAGMLSVPGKTVHDSAVARIRRMFPDATGPLVAHRLDMDTSGILIFGLDPGAQRFLSEQFAKRRTRKIYRALVSGTRLPETGVVNLPIRPDFENRPYQVVDYAKAPSAQTYFRVLARETDRTRLAMIPVTGRTHQLRVHAAHSDGLGSPILGDPLYGPSAAPPCRLMLHAEQLEIRLPRQRQRSVFTSPVPF